MKYDEEGILISGCKVRAIYSDEENEPAWYDAIIESRDNNSGFTTPKYWVIFPEYGNQSLVDLGEIEVPSESKSKKDKDRHRSRSRDRHRGGRRRSSRSRSKDRRSRRSRSYSRSRDRDKGSNDDLLAKVMQSERNNSAAIGKDYARRPASYKGSLALKQDRFTARRRSRSRSPPPRGEYRNRRDRSRSRDREKNSSKSTTATTNGSSSLTSSNVSVEQLEKLRKLKETYGDASAK